MVFMGWWKRLWQWWRPVPVPVRLSWNVTPLEPREVPAQAILFIGNSYTYFERGETNIDDLVREIAVAAGQDAPITQRSFYWGGTLKDHADRLTPQAIRGMLPLGVSQWDAVVIQAKAEESSFEGGQAYFNNANHLRDHALRLVEDIRGACPDARIVLYEPWAKRAQQPEPATIYPNVFANPDAMVRANRSAHLDAITAIEARFPGIDVRLAPAGAAWQRAGNGPELALDGVTHATAHGASLAALTIYRTLYDDDVSDIPVERSRSIFQNRGFSEAQWNRYRQFADAAVRDVETPLYRKLVENLYRDVLGRVVDANGLQQWLGHLNAGRLTRMQVAEWILRSPERQQYQLEAAYREILGRGLDATGRTGWLEQMRRGMTIEQVRWRLEASVEAAGQMDDAQFIRRLYDLLLLRTADETGFRNYFGLLGSGRLDRDGITWAIATSSEAAVLTTQTMYQRLLNRPVDSSGLASARLWLQQGGSLALEAALCASREFANRR
jgi:hypothetical protein